MQQSDPGAPWQLVARLRIRQPRVSWHSFRHTHATLLGDTGGAVKTAQALLGHSDLETMLNTYTHAVPDSQRTAVERVAEGFVLSRSQLCCGGNSERTCKLMWILGLCGRSGAPRRNRTYNLWIKSPLLCQLS